jgi:hypothetical protein
LEDRFFSAWKTSVRTVLDLNHALRISKLYKDDVTRNKQTYGTCLCD